MSGEGLGTAASRRQWLGLLGGSAATLLLLGANDRAAGQDSSRPKRSDPTAPESKDDDAKSQPPMNRALRANDQHIKKSVDRLFQLASELKEEVDKTDSAEVLSLAMVRKAEEIEKLAKEIKSRAKG